MVLYDSVDCLHISGEPRIMDTSRVLNGAVPEVRAIQNVHEKPISPLYPKGKHDTYLMAVPKALEIPTLQPPNYLNWNFHPLEVVSR